MKKQKIFSELRVFDAFALLSLDILKEICNFWKKWKNPEP